MKNSSRTANNVVPLERALNKPITIGEYLYTWLQGKRSLRPSTALSYGSHIDRHLVPHLGEIPVVELCAEQIDAAYQAMLAGNESVKSVSEVTVRRIHAVLHSALSTAVRRGLIPRNPASTVELPRVLRARVTSWTGSELSTFLTSTSEDRLHMLFWLLAVLGLRRGEALALQWLDLDLNDGVCTVRHTASRVGSVVLVGPPKSAAGERVLALDEDTARRLTWHQARQRLDVLQATGRSWQPDLVFTRPDGAALDPAYVSRRFDALVRQLSLPRIRLHDLRHTSASLGLESGETLLEVSRRLGHSSISITADIYSHVSPQVAKGSAERRVAHILGSEKPI